ncbi:GNAT family N-acetyltransferase [Novipirellula sp. SH528]|uniref:GNAT family N-acetyltransferase n=1 Tax=Novipirellula sp. SH528 TaxID=3454466 RepID=UPI003F9EEE52
MMRIISRIVYLPYRVMRRVAIANICCFFVADISDLPVTELPSGMVFTELSPAKLIALRNDYPRKFGPEHLGYLQKNLARGFAVFDGKLLVSTIWMAKGNIPGEINHDGNLATQLPLSLPDGMAYVFSVVVRPEYRGRRLYGVMVSELSSRLKVEGFTRLMLTTEGSNHRALRSVRRMGFQEIGRSMLFGLGNFVLAKYPSRPLPNGIQIGRYAGEPQTEMIEETV